MRFLLAGGGTGGHINPALAIADIIKNNFPDPEIAFVGTKNGMENLLVGREGYPIYHIEARGFQRSLSPRNIAAAWYYVTSPMKAKKLMKEFRPDIVIGTGGYVCYPPLKAAADLGIPTLVHESNATPGLAVRLLQHKVDRILFNFLGSAELLDEKDKCAVVGNPVRGSFGSYSRESARKALGIDDKYRLVLLSYGGSRGAPAINDAAIRIMKEYTSQHPEVLHIHATGKENFAEAKRAFDAAGLGKYKNIEFCDYLYDMPKKLSAADLVISRAGAMTVTEMARLAKPCIMIPSPHVADDHQYKNAKLLEDAGAVRIIREDKATLKVEDRIVGEVSGLLADPAARQGLSRNIAAFAGKDAGVLILREIESLLKKYEKK